MGSSKDRRDGPPPNTRPPSPLMLEFVDVQDPQARSRARSHVVRGWRRQNRLKDIRSQARPSSFASTDERDLSTNAARRSSSMPSLLPVKRQLDLLSENHPQIPSIPIASPSTTTESKLSEKSESEGRHSSSALTSPVSSVDTIGYDPLSTLAIDLDARDREALEYFIGFHSCHTYNVNENSPFNPNRDLVFWAAKHSVPAMHAIIAIALIHLARLRGHDEPTLGMQHIGESMRLLRERLSDVKGNLVDVAMTVCALACVNEFREEFEQSKVHIRAVVMLLRYKGLETLEDQPRVQRYTVYVTTSCFSSSLPDLRPHKTTESSRDQLFDGLNCSDDVLEVHSYISEFLIFVSKVHKVTHRRTDGDRIARPRQKTLFHHNGLLNTIICSSEADHLRGTGLGNERIHRASCLFLIALKLLDMTDSPKQSEEYLKDIQETYVRYQLDVRPNLRLLHHRLIQGKDEACVADLENLWQMVRLMQIFKLLTWETGLRILNDIGNFLGMTTTTHPRPAIDSQHDMSLIVNEVLGALTSDDESLRVGSIPRNVAGFPVEEPVSLPNEANTPRQSISSNHSSQYG